jgi:DNA ligase-1
MRPLLACNAPENLNTLPYPLISSPKLDGIRCLIKDGVAYSRTLKPIRNNYIQSLIGRPEFNGLDGELIVGDPTAPDCMRVTNSGVMSFNGEPDFKFYVFDIWDRPGIQYHKALSCLMDKPKYPYIETLSQQWCHKTSDVEAHEQSVVTAGYEGLILRRPNGLYKYGRSTLKEGYLLKLKRYLQDEAVVIGYEPWQRNDNDPDFNAIGYTQRSQAKDGKVSLPMLGSFVVRGMFQDVLTTFNVGTGFTIGERELLWEKRNELIGRIVTYKYFPGGSKDCPRHPVFVSFREQEDI